MIGTIVQTTGVCNCSIVKQHWYFLVKKKEMLEESLAKGDWNRFGKKLLNLQNFKLGLLVIKCLFHSVHLSCGIVASCHLFDMIRSCWSVPFVDKREQSSYSASVFTLVVVNKIFIPHVFYKNWDFCCFGLHVRAVLLRLAQLSHKGRRTFYFLWLHTLIVQPHKCLIGSLFWSGGMCRLCLIDIYITAIWKTLFSKAVHIISYAYTHQERFGVHCRSYY